MLHSHNKIIKIARKSRLITLTNLFSPWFPLYLDMKAKQSKIWTLVYLVIMFWCVFCSPD